MTLPGPPDYVNVNPNLLEFRQALAVAGNVLSGKRLSVYSRHQHFPMPDGTVLLEQWADPGTLVASPVSPEEALGKGGLPSCWGVDANGEVVVLRYAAGDIHRASNIDVTAEDFLAELAEAGRKFAEANLYEVLELNVAEHLFGRPGLLTFEETDMGEHRHTVTFIPPPQHVLAGDWSHVSCWSFINGEPVVKGFCGG